MNSEASKIALVKMILNIENDTFIQKIARFINQEKDDFWNDLSTLEQEEILLGLQQLEKGERISFDDVLKKIS
ncbi:hypothetical protein FG167_03280 [Lacinutrix sp. WUR7]|uniref:hypothetical protein n=1 Tax=Lacinutrix sp. WUR7 TaxID=2653681 RepID=UPI00193D5690|nr:hypothetical protein [Lacinutrix sp. WUR7]QRM88286.1 hypothetical protein FG167_03280 [Lacinutrix sp. WUR7]